MKASLLALIVSVILTTGCMHFDVENHPKGMDKTALSPKGGIETIHGSLYGFYWHKRTQENIIKAKGDVQLYRVRYCTNIFYCLASVFSIGLYVPETIEWQLVTAQEADGPVM